MLRNLIILTLLLGIAACSTSPTGRKQLALVPDAQLEEMGKQSFEELKQREPISKDTATTEYVSCVARAITTTLPEKREWEVVTFAKPEVNAFALPGAKIGVFEGLLKAAQNQHQLAAVLGHEVAHVLAKHGQERVSEQLAAQGGLGVLGAILGAKGDKRRGLLLAALGLGAQVGVLLPHSRKQESEGDVLGLEYMAKAGFDPRESVALWENMAKAGGGQPPEFMSTHPSHGTRIETLRARIPEVLPFYEAHKNKPICRPAERLGQR